MSLGAVGAPQPAIPQHDAKVTSDAARLITLGPSTPSRRIHDTASLTPSVTGLS